MGMKGSGVKPVAGQGFDLHALRLSGHKVRSAIDRKDSSGNITGSIRCQVKGRLCNILWLTEATQWYALL